MNGLEATRLIREISPGIPVIAYTAYALSRDMDKAKEYNFNEYITKPANRNKLLKIVRRYL